MSAATSACPDGYDIVVLDADLDPDFEHIRTAADHGSRLVVVARSASAASVSGALGAGAHGYLTGNCTIADLIGAVTAAAESSTYVDVSATGALIEAHRLPAPADVTPTVSPREREVLQQVALGSTNAQIAECLGVSSQTVKTHLARIYKKMSAPDRASALYTAVRLGLLE